MVNGYFIFLLSALLLVHAVDALARLVNLKSLASEPPREMVGYYDPDIYANSQRYTRATTVVGLLESLFDLGVLCAFWFAGGFGALDTWIKTFRLGPFSNGLLYIGLLALAGFALQLPFGAYATFVVEERFGFNRTRFRTFLADRLRELLLGAILGGAVVAAILAFFRWAGPLAWLCAWGAVSAILLLVSFVAPTWILPLFNRFTPLPEGELRRAIFAYAEAVAFPLGNVFVIDGSKRSSKSNAFFTGFGRNKRIALFDTLIEKHSVAELVAVLAHEVGHYKLRHVQLGILVNLCYLGLLLCLFSFLQDSRQLFDAFGVQSISTHAALVFFAILFTPLSFFLSIFMNLWSRRNEYRADRFAAETTADPGQLVTALKKLSLANLSNLNPHPFFVFLNYSHPPVLERIRALERLGAGKPVSPIGKGLDRYIPSIVTAFLAIKEVF